MLTKTGKEYTEETIRAAHVELDDWLHDAIAKYSSLDDGQAHEIRLRAGFMQGCEGCDDESYIVIEVERTTRHSL